MDSYFEKNRVCKLLDITFPLIQAGMVWVAGGKLAAASAESGILGVVGAGSMKPDLLTHHIKKAKALTSKSLAVNIPLLYPHAKEQVDAALKEGIKIFITSAGTPKLLTSYLKDLGCKVIHVVSSPTLALKCEEAGVDAVIAEGFEAGGHNGREEITTLVLIPQVVQAVKIPVIAAGGFGNGKGIAAGLALGAEGIQMGTRFVATQESSAHQNFLKELLQANPGSTMLCMKNLVPVRLLKNDFFLKVQELEKNGASKEDLQNLLGKGRAKKGMLEGDTIEGELEIGQICSLIKDIPSTRDLVERLKKEFHETLDALCRR